MLRWRHGAGIREARVGFPAREGMLCDAEPHGACMLVSAGCWQGHSYGPSSRCHPLGHSTGAVTHPRTAQAAAMWLHAAYSADACFIWFMRSITFWGWGHVRNTLISGAMVQSSTDLGCSGHSWHPINTCPVSQANWGLQRRLSVIFTLSSPILSYPALNLWETSAMGVFTSVLYGYIGRSPLLHTLLLPWAVLLVVKRAAIRPPLLGFSPSHSAFPSPDDQAEWPKGHRRAPRQLHRTGRPALPNRCAVSYCIEPGLQAAKPALEK